MYGTIDTIEGSTIGIRTIATRCVSTITRGQDNSCVRTIRTMGHVTIARVLRVLSRDTSRVLGLVDQE